MGGHEGTGCGRMSMQKLPPRVTGWWLTVEGEALDGGVVPIESFPDQKLASGHHGDSWTNKPAKCDDRVSPLSPY